MKLCTGCGAAGIVAYATIPVNSTSRSLVLRIVIFSEKTVSSQTNARAAIVTMRILKTYEEVLIMTAEKVVEYLETHTELYNRLIEELDDYNGYLEEDRWFPMYELSDKLCGFSNVEVLNMAFNGGFNPNHDYFKFDGYGNLESGWYVDYSDNLDEWFVKNLAENRRHVDIGDSTLDYMLRELERGEFE